MRDFRSTTNIKLGLFILAVVIISTSLIYTNWLVKELRDDNLRFLEYNSNLLANALAGDLQSKAYQEEQKEFLSYNAKLYADALSADSPSMDFAFNQIIRNIRFPIIITVLERGEKVVNAYRNIDIPDSLADSSITAYILDLAAEMDLQNAPIPITYLNREIMQIHFGQPESSTFQTVMADVLKAVNFPMILTSDLPSGEFRIQEHTLAIDTMLSPAERQTILQGALRRMDAENQPVPVLFKGATVMKIHYEDSELIQALRWFPYIEFGIMGAFILLACPSSSGSRERTTRRRGRCWRRRASR